MKRFEYFEPATLAEASSLLARYGARAQPLAWVGNRRREKVSRLRGERTGDLPATQDLVEPARAIQPPASRADRQLEECAHGESVAVVEVRVAAAGREVREVLLPAAAGSELLADVVE